MKTHAEKLAKGKSQSVINAAALKQDGKSTFQFVDNRPETLTKKQEEPPLKQSVQLSSNSPVQRVMSTSSVVQLAGKEDAEKVNTKTEFRQTTTNFFGFRGSDHELDTIDGFLDEYHEIVAASPKDGASKGQRKHFSNLRLKKLDAIEQQLRGWLKRKKAEPNNKYRAGVRDLLSQVRNAQRAQKASSEKAGLNVPLSAFEKKLKRLSADKTPAWKKKARAKSGKAKKRKQEAREKEERRKRIIGTVLNGMMLSSSAIDMYNELSQAPRFSSTKGGSSAPKKDVEPEKKHSSSNSTSTGLELVKSKATQGHGVAISSTGTLDMMNPQPMSRIYAPTVSGTSGEYVSEIPTIEKSIFNHAKNKSLTHPERVDAAVQRGLLFGVSTARGNSGHGQKPLLGSIHVSNTMSALEGMGVKEHKQFMDLYNLAGHNGTAKVLDQHSVSTQQSLLLKALGARKGAFTSGTKDVKQGAMDELHEFATNIRSIPRASLVKQITPYDVDESVSDSSFAPSNIEHMGMDGKTPHDRFSENDGLFQHFVMSCGQTSFMVAKAEADPVYALKLHDETFVKKEQKRIAKSVTEGSSSRVAMRHYKILEQKVKAKDTDTTVHTPGHELLKYANSTLTDLPESGKKELETIREGNSGWPTDDHLSQMREFNMAIGQRGIDKDEHADIANKEIGVHTDLEYERVLSAPRAKGDITSEATELFKKGVIDKKEMRRRQRGADDIVKSHQPNLILRVAKAVKEGHVVPLNIPSHTMSIVDVKPSSGGYSFLIHDPWTGKSLWFKQKDLFKGNKVATAFGMPASGDRYIGDFILPKV